jgi:hypothetical protein
MLRKPARLICDSFGVSPAEILFGDVTLLDDFAPERELRHAADTSYHWLATAEACLRKTQFTECQRFVSQALRCIGADSRALSAEEWLFLAGVAMMNADHESATHRIMMARNAEDRQKTVDSGSKLHLRILILQSLIIGVSSPEAGKAELLDVFRYLARHRCPSLCRQALFARRLLQEWNEPGSSVAWGRSLRTETAPCSEPGDGGTERCGPANPEWN